MLHNSPTNTSIDDPRPFVTAAECLLLMCCVIGVAASACSVALNAAFYSSFGRTTREAILLGCVVGVLDVAKSILPIAVQSFQLWRWKIISLVAFVVLVFASFIASLGFFSINRDAMMGELVERGALVEKWKLELTGLDVELTQFRERRSIAEIDALIQQVMGSASRKNGRSSTVGEASENCIKPEPSTQTACDRVLQRRSERATAERRTDQETRHRELRARLEASTDRAGYSSGDPQVRRIAQMFSMSKEHVEVLLAVLFAATVELGSGLMLTIGVHGTERRRLRRSSAYAARAHDLPSPTSIAGTPEPENHIATLLDAYCADRLVISPAEETQASTILHDALAWLEAHGVDPTRLTAGRLGRFLQSEKGYVTEKRKGRIVYVGVKVKTEN